MADESSDPVRLPDTAAVLFSGGRDSSLATVILALDGYCIQPIRFQTGTGIPSELPDVRLAELATALPDRIRAPALLASYSLTRRIAIANIEQDFRIYSGKNLILLGEMMSLITCAIAYCREAKIRVLASGFSGYQTDMPEQRPVAVDWFVDFCRSYGVQLVTPIRRFESADEVKYQLLDIGVSTKSLEGISIFSDSFSRASDDTILQYLQDKEQECRSFLERRRVAAEDEELD